MAWAERCGGIGGLPTRFDPFHLAEAELGGLGPLRNDQPARDAGLGAGRGDDHGVWLLEEGEPAEGGQDGGLGPVALGRETTPHNSLSTCKRGRGKSLPLFQIPINQCFLKSTPPWVSYSTRDRP